MDKGKAIELEKVLLVSDGDKITAGNPTVDGAKVLATWHSEGRDKKVIAFKYKAKTRYHRKLGHRQPYTKLTIDKIVAPGIAEVVAAKPKTRTRRAKKEVTPDGA